MNSGDAALLGKAYINAGELMGLSNTDLERVIGCDIVQDLLINPQSKEGELAIYFIRIFKKLFGQLNGSKEEMQLWMKGFNKGTKGIPLEQIMDKEGLYFVMSYLESHR